MSAPRVLVSGVVLSQPMGGVRRHNQELLPRVAVLLRERGGSLAVLVGREGLAIELPEWIERIPSNVPARPALVRATLEGRTLRSMLAAASLSGRAFDLVHTAHLPVPRQLPVRYTLTLHDLRSLELEHSPLSRRLIGKKVIGEAVARAAAVMTVSETVRSQLVERFRLDPARVSVVANAADHFAALSRSVRPDSPILYVGHLEPRKNVELLLRALALDETLPDLCLAGAAKGEEDERLRALAIELRIAPRVRFLGAFDDRELPSLYASAACLALPSRIEGFGIPVLEAQRARVPVAVARAGALIEVAGENAPSFDPNDPAECAYALRAAISSPADAIDRASRRADGFRWQASAERWCDVWCSAAGT
jgi:glycosyltransferase involved in cell wall biosynthesis